MSMTAGQPPANAVVVRSATLGDLPGLQEVARCTWRATNSGYIPEAKIERFLAANDSVGALSQALVRLGDGMLVAVVNDRVIGYALCGETRERRGELFAIYVLPEWQKKSIGRRLWEQAVEHLRSLGVPDMVIWVLAANELARRFYERQGAEVFATRTFPVGDAQIEEVGVTVHTVKLAEVIEQ
ncbi:MAG: hypothetical protein C4345_01245 [Chloroflexota bacterium]